MWHREEHHHFDEEDGDEAYAESEEAEEQEEAASESGEAEAEELQALPPGVEREVVQPPIWATERRLEWEQPKTDNSAIVDQTRMLLGRSGDPLLEDEKK